jgi:hypothetical protein
MGKFGSGADGGQDGYQNHKCNSFYQEDEEVMMKKEELKRFEWYSERYNNHCKSKAHEKHLLDNSDGILKMMIDDHSISWIAAQFYTNAIKQLLAVRQIAIYNNNLCRTVKRSSPRMYLDTTDRCYVPM